MIGSEEAACVSGTPILDSGVLPPRARKKSAVGFVTGVVGGFIFGLMIAAIGERADGDLYPGEGMLIFVAALALSVTVHECGHLLAGRAVGFRFSFVSIGPFSLRVERGVLKLRIRREMSALGKAGMYANGVRRLRRRMLIYIAGGPTANLISVLFVILLTNYSLSRLKYSWPSTLGTVFVIVSILIFTLSLLPLPNFSNDGSHIGMLLWSRERARRRMSTTAVGSQQQKGTSPKHWRQTWLKAATSLHDNSVDEFSANWIAYISANARKDILLASLHLERCLELSPLIQHSSRDLVAQEAAIFAAWFRRDAVLAEKWAAQIKKPQLIQPLLRIRTDLALRCARRDFTGASNIWQQGFKFIEKLPVTPAQDQLRESWLEWQTEIQERQNEPATA